MTPAGDRPRIVTSIPPDAEDAEPAPNDTAAQVQRASVRAALATLAKVTQPSLTDFLR
jgi:hypothetical protein